MCAWGGWGGGVRKGGQDVSFSGRGGVEAEPIHRDLHRMGHLEWG